MGPRLRFCCSAWIPGDRMPCAFSLGSLPLPRAGPAVPGRRLGATKPQERLGGRWVMPDSAPPHVQRLPGSPPNIKRWMSQRSLPGLGLAEETTSTGLLCLQP